MFPQTLRELAAIVAALAASLSITGAAAAFSGELTLLRGQAEVRSYDRPPATIILGDAEIAAASIAANDVLVLTARSAGLTNMIVLDELGVEMDRFLVRVTEPGGDVKVRRALTEVVLRCDPSCRPFDFERRPSVEPTTTDEHTSAEGPAALDKERTN